MAAVKQRAHVELLDRWLSDLRRAAVLKTDLWEEGVAGDELLFTLARRSATAHGIDISQETVASASRAAQRAGVVARLQTADLCRLPFRDGAMDAIVSTSTLDHLSRADRPRALAEMRRMLSPTGVLVITADNADNLGDGLLRLANRLGLVPFPLGPSLSRRDLGDLLVRAGFDCGDHAYLVPGPRLLTTAAVRAVRLALPGRWAEPALVRLLDAFAAVGRRAPARMGAFVALRATPATGRVPEDRLMA